MEPSIASEFNYDIETYYAEKKAKLLEQYQMIQNHQEKLKKQGNVKGSANDDFSSIKWIASSHNERTNKNEVEDKKSSVISEPSDLSQSDSAIDWNDLDMLKRKV